MTLVVRKGLQEEAKPMMVIWSRPTAPEERFRAPGVGYERAHPALEEAATRTFGRMIRAITGGHEAKQVRGGDAQTFAVSA